VFGLSIGLNVAFFAVWGFFTIEDYLEAGQDWKHENHQRQKWDRDKNDPAWWFYRKKLNVTESQWENLRPDLREFHRRAYRMCRKIGRIRNDLLGLIADGAGTKRIESKKEEIIELRRRKQEMAIEYFRGKKEFLNTDQLAELFSVLRHKPRCAKHARFIESENSPRETKQDAR